MLNQALYVSILYDICHLQLSWTSEKSYPIDGVTADSTDLIVAKHIDDIAY